LHFKLKPLKNMKNLFLFSKRFIDLTLSIFLILPVSILIIIIYFFVKFTSRGPFIHWSKRIGKDNYIFNMPKIRTMSCNTPQKATHLLNNPSQYMTNVGTLLRKSSLDELPQLFLILKGDMSIVGPRPALFNQYDLIKLRKKNGIHKLKPGLTGWAQVKGRDNLSIEQKVQMDLFYLKNQSIYLDLKIIIFSFFIIFKKDIISH